MVTIRSGAYNNIKTKCWWGERNVGKMGRLCDHSNIAEEAHLLQRPCGSPKVHQVKKGREGKDLGSASRL